MNESTLKAYLPQTATFTAYLRYIIFFLIKEAIEKQNTEIITITDLKFRPILGRANAPARKQKTNQFKRYFRYLKKSRAM